MQRPPRQEKITKDPFQTELPMSMQLKATAILPSGGRSKGLRQIVSDYRKLKDTNMGGTIKGSSSTNTTQDAQSNRIQLVQNSFSVQGAKRSMLQSAKLTPSSQVRSTYYQGG